MCYCASDFGTSEAYCERRRRARKEHRCAECRRVIRVGEQYVHVFQVWEGEPCTTKFCLDCDAVAEAFGAAQQAACGCSGWEIGNLWGEIAEFCREHLYYDPETGEEYERPRARERFVVMGATA